MVPLTLKKMNITCCETLWYVFNYQVISRKLKKFGNFDPSENWGLKMTIPVRVSNSGSCFSLLESQTLIKE